MYMLWSEEDISFFFPPHRRAVPFAYEMHSGDENVKGEATHSALWETKMDEVFLSKPHPWALATGKI